MACLSDLPTDILLTLVSSPDLDLEDAISFSRTCHKFREFSHQRGFWIGVLESARIKGPLLCTPHQDFSDLDLDSLRRIAYHAHRLRHNWATPIPLLVSSNFIMCFSTSSILFTIPGTDLVVLGGTSAGGSGVVTCWDTKNEVLLSLLETDVPLKFTYETPPYHGYGVTSIAGLTEQRTLVILCVDWAIPDEIQMRITSHHREFGNDWIGTMKALALNSDLLVTCRLSKFGGLELRAFNLQQRRSKILRTDIPYETASGSCISLMFLENDLFIITDHLTSPPTVVTSILYRCPSRFFPYSGCPYSTGDYIPCLVSKKAISHWPSHMSAEKLDRVLTSSFSGNMISAFHTRPHRNYSTVGKNRLRFWQFQKSQGSSAPVQLKNPRELDLPADIVWAHGVGSSAWCTKAVFVIQFTDDMSRAGNQGGLALHLACYHPETSSTSLHELDVPSHIDLQGIRSIGLDDHGGTVLLLDQSEELHVLRYA